MKKLKFVFLSMLMMGIFFTACNSGTSEKGAESKITDIPASSSSPEALTAFNDGMSYLDMGNRNQARVSFSSAVTADPKFGMAYLMRSLTSPSAKEFADDLNTGKANVGSASAWEKMYADMMATNLTGESSKRLEILEKIAAEYPDAARAQVDLGNGYAGDNQTAKSRASYTKAIELNPKWVGGYLAMTNSLLFNDPIDLNKAEENAKKAVELAPNSAGMHITLGDCYRAQNDFQKARESYAKAVSLDSKDPSGYYKLGHANSYLGNLDEARKNFSDAGLNDNTKQAAILFTAYTYLYGDDPKAAIKHIQEQIAAQPEMNNSQKSNCLSTIAEIALHTGDASTLKSAVESMKPLNEQLNIDLGNTTEIKIFGQAENLHWDAMLDITNGNFDAAQKNLEAMKTVLEPIKDNRKLERYYHDMGQMHMKQKKYADAVADFEKSNPNDMYNKYSLAKANEGAGNKEKAQVLYKEVAAYNFNEVGNALMRSEVKKKITGS